ncbi:MAG: bifunctional diaminohydroxyphosphoribosylaminopyrimidine deaminase/5-amino-6-(5-phosphoribosylamino)uracil reductase RibD, partial [Gammaproteobacteria bacterium]
AGLAHAEIVAMQDAADPLEGATAFVTLEPCSHHGRTGPCADALIKAGITQVVIAAVDSSPQVSGDGIARLEEHGIEVIRLQEFRSEAERLNPGWLSRQRRSRPYVRCKLAMSLDGRTALANGASKWISGPEARADVQLLRASSDAIVTGVQTVLSDDLSLDVRSSEAAGEYRQLIEARMSHAGQPMRVIVDSRLRTPPQARIFNPEGEVKIFATRAAQPAGKFPESGEVIAVAEKQGRVHLESMLESLTSSFGCNEIMVEAGPTLSAAFLEADLIDEMIVYIAPKLLGSDARALMALSGLASLDDAYELEFCDVTRIGNDLKVTAKPIRQD